MNEENNVPVVPNSTTGNTNMTKLSVSVSVTKVGFKILFCCKRLMMKSESPWEPVHVDYDKISQHENDNINNDQKKCMASTSITNDSHRERI